MGEPSIGFGGKEYTRYERDRTPTLLKAVESFDSVGVARLASRVSSIFRLLNWHAISA
jgi:hypothetical protein